MSIEVRQIGANKYVTLTQRSGDKVLKHHLGSLNDPMAELVFRQARLSRIELDHAKELQKNRRQTDKTINHVLRIAASLGSRTTINILIKLQVTPMNSPESPNEPPFEELFAFEAKLKELPGSRDVNEQIRHVKARIINAETRLEHTRAEYEHALENASWFVAYAREQILRDFAGESSSVREQLEEMLEAQIESLRSAIKQIALSVMFAELVIVAWIDAMRCGIYAGDSQLARADASYWGSRADKANRRLIQLTQAFYRLVYQVA